MLSNLFCGLNFFAIFLLTFFLGSKKIIKNLFVALLLTLFFVSELLSVLYYGHSIEEDVLFCITNLKIFYIALNIKILMVYACIYLLIVIFAIFYLILQKVHIQKFKNYFITFSIVIFLLPGGFVYNIFYIFAVNYGYDYLKYKNATYQELYRKEKDVDYVVRDEIKILNNNQKHKNLVLIYLESYEENLLTNSLVKEYTKDISKIAKEGEFYTNLPQLSAAMGTFNGMFTTLCGARLFNYALFKNPYGEIIDDLKFTCMSDVLNKANYEQVFIGGADKFLFNKGNLMLSHSYDVVEDKFSLVNQYPELKDKLNEWGIADFDVFEIAKERYKKLSESGKNFNLTILTTATHNINGIKDERCKNSSKDNNLLNAVECTDILVSDFVDFLKKQPNYKDTIVVILPDHIQYELNGLRDIIKDEERTLFTIILNTGIKKEYNNPDIDYTNIPIIILDKLNVKSNATFLDNFKDETVIKNFIHKTHFGN